MGAARWERKGRKTVWRPLKEVEVGKRTSTYLGGLSSEQTPFTTPHFDRLGPVTPNLETEYKSGEFGDELFRRSS